MASLPPINTPQATDSVASVVPLAGKTTGYRFGSTGDKITANLPGMAGVDTTLLLYDALGVVIQDSVRAGNFKADVKLISSYVGASAVYNLYGANLLMPLLSNLDPSLRFEVGQILFNGVALVPLARIFGARISLTDAFLTASGATFFSAVSQNIAGRA